jgi:membrane-bound serine protease (ClpP class)
MGAFESILLLSLVGFLLLAAEVFVPGLILGLLGGLCLVAAAVVAFGAYGFFGGTLVAVALAVLTGVGLVVWMFAFPHTSLGRRITLHPPSPAGRQGTSAARLLGKEGRALTALRPAGTAVIEGRKVDVVSEGDFVQPGEPVVVVREEGLRVLVRKKV